MPFAFNPYFSQGFAKQVGRDVFRDLNEILRKWLQPFPKELRKILGKQILQIVPKPCEKCGLNALLAEKQRFSVTFTLNLRKDG